MNRGWDKESLANYSRILSITEEKQKATKVF